MHRKLLNDDPRSQQIYLVRTGHQQVRDYMKIMTLLLVEESSNRLAIARLILAQGYDLFPHPHSPHI